MKYFSLFLLFLLISCNQDTKINLTTKKDDINVFSNKNENSNKKPNPNNSVSKNRAFGLIQVKKFAEAHSILIELSEENDPWALNNLGLLYLNGHGVKINKSRAFKYFTKANKLGDVWAKSNLAWLYLNGIGTTIDKNKAYILFKDAAEKDNFNAQYNLGIMYRDGNGVKKDCTKSFDLIRKAAKQWVAIAMFTLGSYYKDGICSKVNYNKARMWLRRATDKGSYNAATHLGLMFENGLGVDKNFDEAAAWYRLGAENGNMYAQANLGLLYERGDGVKQNYETAAQWFRLAARLGLKKAENDLKRVEKIIKSSESDYDQNTLRLLKQAEANYIKENYKEAWIDYKILADKGIPEAQYKLYGMYRDGLGVDKKDKLDKSINLWRYLALAAKQNFVPALLSMGQNYEEGIHIDINFNIALDWYRKAARFKNHEMYGVALARVAVLEEKIKKKSNNEILNLKLKNLEDQIALLKSQKNLKRGVSFEKAKVLSLQNSKKFHALIIAVKDYKYLTPLKTPVKDALAIGNVLKNKYGFDVEYLENPTRKVITSKLNKLSKTLSKNDNLLIYFAGHGKIVLDDGFWLPHDAEEDDDTNWLSNDYLGRKLKNIKAVNILILSDSCYSGTLTRAPKDINTSKIRPIDIYLNTKSRMVITSGGLSPVLDGGGDGHSIFARILLNYLINNSEPITATQMYSSTNKDITNLSIKLGIEQTPMLASMPRYGHIGPDFVFLPR